MTAQDAREMARKARLKPHSDLIAQIEAEIEKQAELGRNSAIVRLGMLPGIAEGLGARLCEEFERQGYRVDFVPKATGPERMNGVEVWIECRF